MQEMQHEATGEVFREVFAKYGNGKELRAAMDARRTELENKGYKFVRRGKIGRNAPCPCDSGAKFKKCCIAKFERAAGGTFLKV